MKSAVHMKNSPSIWYFLLLLIGATFLLAGPFAFGFSMRTTFLFGVLYVITVHTFQVRIIYRRQLNSLHRLNYASSWLDYILVAVIITAIVFCLAIDSKSSTYSYLLPLSFIGILGQTVSRLWLRAPRYVLTTDQLQENDFYLQERKLDDLHSICFDWTSLVVRIRFSHQYDIQIFRPRYSKQQLADFIQRIIDQSPVEADIHPEVQEFLKAHASLSLH